MSNLLSLGFWFNFRPEPLEDNNLKYFIGLLFFFLAGNLVLVFLKRKYGRSLYKKFLDGLSSFALVNLIVGAFLLFFAYEGVPFLSARFWFLLWAAGLIVWLVFIARNLAAVPKIKERLEAEKKYRQYIP